MTADGSHRRSKSPARTEPRSFADRLLRDGVKEGVLAVNATVDGQTTAHCLTDPTSIKR